jgi:HEAT repeat protein
MGSNTRTKEILRTLHDSNWALRADTIATLRTEEIADIAPALAECLHDEAWPVRANAALALGQIGDKSATTTLTEVLHDPEWAVRRHAAAALGIIEDTAALPGLIERLDDSEWIVRLEAVSALGIIGDKSATQALLNVLRNDSVWTVQLEAADALGYIGDTTAIDGLLTASEEAEWPVRASALLALGRIGDPKVAAYLLQLLRDDDNFNIRQAAACALGALKMLDTVPQLSTALSDEAWPVRACTVLALGYIGVPSITDTMINLRTDTESGVRWAVTWALATIQGSQIPDFRAALQDPDPQVQWVALWGLAITGETNRVEKEHQ